MEVAAVFGGLALYLYLEIWTIRICRRYSGWLVAWVLLIDHALLFVSVTLFPAYLFWKVWFLWTSTRAEPLRGVLWVPQLLPEPRPLTWQQVLLRRVLLLTALSLGVLSLVGSLLSGDGEAFAGVLLILMAVTGLFFLLRWLGGHLWRVFGPQKRIPEPQPWDRGPVSW